MNSVYIGLGTNIGNRLENLKLALQHLSKVPHVKIIKLSSVYESEPMYYEDQDRFYNAVAEIETTLDPVFLLMKLKEIESAMGRNLNAKRNRPRVIDLDIEFFDDLVMETETLEIPHPGLYDRMFVLKPLSELNRSFKCCKTGKTVEILINDCDDKSTITKVGKINI